MRTDEIVVGGRYVFWNGHAEAVGRVVDVDVEDEEQAPLVLMKEEVGCRLVTRRAGHLLARLGEPIYSIKWPPINRLEPVKDGPLGGSERDKWPLIR